MDIHIQTIQINIGFTYIDLVLLYVKYCSECYEKTQEIFLFIFF